MGIIPYAAMERILKKAGAKRVSDDAKVTFSLLLEEKALLIGEKAVGIAKNCGRKTVNSKDIKLVKL